MNARPLRLESYSREELGYCNAIARLPRERPLGRDDEWRLTVERHAAGDAPAGRLHLEADWGGARFTVAVDPDVAQRLLRHAVPDAEFTEIPEALRLAALEALRQRVERGLARRNGAAASLRLTALRERPPQAAPRHRFAFALASRKSGETIAGEIGTDTLGLALAAPLLKGAPQARAQDVAAWVDALPIPVRFEAGWSTLAADELREIAAGDLVLLDEAWLTAGELAVAVAPGIAFRARLEGQRLVVSQPLGAIMSETTAPPEAARAGAESSPAERIPVRLTFELGERTLTVAELRELKPGFVFDLGRDLRRAVAIRAHGQLIGEGDLVEVDGRLGVAVASLEGLAAVKEPRGA